MFAFGHLRVALAALHGNPKTGAAPARHFVAVDSKGPVLTWHFH